MPGALVDRPAEAGAASSVEQVELIVDAYAHHIAALPHVNRVPTQDYCRGVLYVVAEIVMQILELCRPMRGEHLLNPRARDPSAAPLFIAAIAAQNWDYAAGVLLRVDLPKPKAAGREQQPSVQIDAGAYPIG